MTYIRTLENQYPKRHAINFTQAIEQPGDVPQTRRMHQVIRNDVLAKTGPNRELFPFEIDWQSVRTIEMQLRQQKLLDNHI